MAHIAVIGAGVTGVTTAYALTKRGHDVTVIERHPYAAMETSYANGGQLSACNAEVWNSVPMIMKGAKWLFKKDAPLLFNLKPSWHKYSWMAEFVSAIPNYEQNTKRTVELALAARKHLFAIAEQESIDFNHEKRGILHIFHNDEAMRQAEAVNKILNDAGLERYKVSPGEIKAIEPTLQGKFVGGFFTPSDSTGDIHKFTSGLAKACAQKGVNFFYNTEVESIETDEKGVMLTSHDVETKETHIIQYDAMVVCAGVGSRRIAAMLGDRVNVYPVKGYSITVMMRDQENQALAPYVSLLDEAAKIVTSRLGADRLRVAGTAEFNGENKDIRADRIEPLVRWTRRMFPELNTSECIPWTGLRPMMPDMMPRVMPSKQKHVFYNTGHGHLGWTLSAVTAEMVAELANSD